MWQRRTVLVLFACLAGLGALLFLFGHPREPRYQNRPLSYWVAMLAGPQARRPEAKEAPAAVTTIGTNALPFLLDWIQYEPPPWNAKLTEVIARLKRTLPEEPHHRSGREYLAVAADRALWILGTRALPAIPELTRLMNDPSRPETARRAAGALRAFGTNSLPVLLAVVDNPKHPCRTTAILALQIMRRHFGPAIDPALPHLIQCLDPTNGLSAPGWAARALGEFKSAPQLVVPALTNCFSNGNKYLRITCAEGLARIGAPAASALPVLTNALADPAPEACSAARKAISTITALTATNAPAR